MAQSPGTPFSGIFVCYRRDDSSGYAVNLRDRLVDRFGKDRIFMDHDIKPGEDFKTVIENAVGSCEILIAVIGPHWLSSVNETAGVSHRPIDYVRLEIATALSRDVRVMPVLVQGATMPQAQDLPDDLARLSRRQAIELSNRYFRDDVDRLIGVLEGMIKGPTRSRHKLLYASLGALMIAVLLGGLYVYLNARNQRIDSPLKSSPERTSINVPIQPTPSPPLIENPDQKGENKQVEKIIAQLKAEKKRAQDAMKREQAAMKRAQDAIDLLAANERQNSAQKALLNQTSVR